LFPLLKEKKEGCHWICWVCCYHR